MNNKIDRQRTTKFNEEFLVLLNDPQYCKLYGIDYKTLPNEQIIIGKKKFYEDYIGNYEKELVRKI